MQFKKRCYKLTPLIRSLVINFNKSKIAYVEHINKTKMQNKKNKNQIVIKFYEKYY